MMCTLPLYCLDGKLSENKCLLSFPEKCRLFKKSASTVGTIAIGTLKRDLLSSINLDVMHPHYFLATTVLIPR